jgi:hypothetical protein
MLTWAHAHTHIHTHTHTHTHTTFNRVKQAYVTAIPIHRKGTQFIIKIIKIKKNQTK